MKRGQNLNSCYTDIRSDFQVTSFEFEVVDATNFIYLLVIGSPIVIY